MKGVFSIERKGITEAGEWETFCSNSTWGIDRKRFEGDFLVMKEPLVLDMGNEV